MKRNKLLLLLVLLLMAATGAWAQETQTWTSGDCTVTLSDGVMTVSGAGAMADYKDSYELPWYGKYVKTIVIESGVTSIGNSAFAKCYNLESVSIPASVTSIGSQAFEDCGYDAEALTVSFAEGSTPLTIGEVAFNYANLKSIDIPNRVTSIGAGAFTSCRKLESVSIPASVTSIGNFAFQNCGSDATALTVSFAEGSTLESIGESTFLEAKLTSINIPNCVTSIGTFAFSGCSNLESVSIPAGVTSIGYNAFSSCSKLESVSIPASVTSISEGAFRYCGKLAKVYIYAPSLTTYGANAFTSNAAGRKIYVLPDAVDTYKAGWPAYAADIEAMEYFNTFTLTLGTNANEKGTVEVINELTVNDGTITNSVVPAQTIWFDAITKSQYVIPAAKLSTLNGCKIKSLKYYVSETKNWESSKDIDVYVKEVEYTTMTDMEDKANCTKVYTGKLTVANGEAIITFATPYTYNGGNLLVGLENLEEGDCTGFDFLGVNAEGASMGGHGDSYNKQDFLPKVTFDYDNPNIKDNGDGTYDVEPGALITVKATPAEGYYLKNWSDDETNNEAIRTITMESDKTLTAIFDNCAVLTIAANDASRGVAYVVNAQEKLIDTFDTEHTNGTVTYFDNFNDIVDGYWVNNNEFYSYIGVHCKSDNLNMSRVVFYGPGDNSYEASVSGYDVMIYLKNGNIYKDNNCTELLWTGGVRKLDVYATEYALPESVSETTTPGSYYVVPGSKVPVEAAPFVQYSFSGWSNSETKAAFELTVNETTILTANFVANPVLTIAPSSAEMGTVSIQTVEGEGLIAKVVAANVEGNAEVEGIDMINAPYIEAEQTEWTNNDEYPRHFVIDDQKVSSVVFYGRNGRYVSKGDNNMYTSRTMEPQAAPRKMPAKSGGSVYLKDGNTYRDWNCTQLLWKGGVTRIEIYGNGTVLPDGVVANNAEAGIYTVAPGTEVTVTATPAEKCHLQSWSDGAELNEQNTNTFTMTAENKNLVAFFMPDTYQLVIGAGEFATFYEDWNVKLDEDTPEGVNFYTIASVSGETAVLSAALEGVVAGQTPLLVYNGTENVLLVTIVPTTETAEATPSFAEQFRGTAIDKEFTAADMEAADFYALSGGKIFVQVEGEGTLAANQCWLQFNHELTPGARSINIVFEDETTSIQNLTPALSEGEGVFYNLNGCKVTVPTKKGVYILNGKKVVK